MSSTTSAWCNDILPTRRCVLTLRWRLASRRTSSSWISVLAISLIWITVARGRSVFCDSSTARTTLLLSFICTAIRFARSLRVHALHRRGRGPETTRTGAELEARRSLHLWRRERQDEQLRDPHCLFYHEVPVGEVLSSILSSRGNPGQSSRRRLRCCDASRAGPRPNPADVAGGRLMAMPVATRACPISTRPSLTSDAGMTVPSLANRS